MQSLVDVQQTLALVSVFAVCVIGCATTRESTTLEDRSRIKSIVSHTYQVLQVFAADNDGHIPTYDSSDPPPWWKSYGRNVQVSPGLRVRTTGITGHDCSRRTILKAEGSDVTAAYGADVLRLELAEDGTLAAILRR